MGWQKTWRGRLAIAAAAFLILGSLLAGGLIQGWHHGIAAAARRVSEAGAEGDRPEHDHAGHAGHGEHGDHGEHGPGREEHDDANSLELSEQARRSLDLKTGAAVIGTFTRRISVPGTIVPWPGRTHVTIATPLTGTVTAVHVAQGETVISGAPLYTVRLTHQDLVRAQSEFLQTLGEADVERQEIERLTGVAESGAIARRSLLERQYAFDKLLAELRAMRESLLLHGLSQSQVQRIEDQRQLVREVTVFAPVVHGDRSLHDEVLESGAASLAARGSGLAPVAPTSSDGGAEREHIQAQWVVTELTAERGQAVGTGDPLTVLADYETLLAEGHAFQQDAEALVEAARSDAPVQAVFDRGGEPQRVLGELRIAYVASEVRTDSRALPFYVPLENEKVREELHGERRYTSWRFKPGQRLRLRIPVERVENVIVLPVEAIAAEGVESYLFVDQGDHFERRPVEVVLRDQLHVAIAADGSLAPGEIVALSDAHQLQMALKNRASGGAGPHAGHNH